MLSFKDRENQSFEIVENVCKELIASLKVKKLDNLNPIFLALKIKLF